MPKKKKEPYANSSFDTDKAIAMRNDGATYKQIANAIGCSQSQVARICQYSGECKTAPRNRGFNLEREKLIGEWLKLARKGYSTYEIAAMYPDYSRYYIGNKLNGRGYRPGKGNGGAAKANAERSKKANLKQLLDAQEELGDRFIVCSIFKNNHALLICKECGYVFDRYLDPSVKEHRCPQCEAKSVEEKKVKREAEHIEQLKRAQMQKLVNLLAYEHRCPQCGRAFRSSNPKNASLQCSSGDPRGNPLLLFFLLAPGGTAGYPPEVFFCHRASLTYGIIEMADDRIVWRLRLDGGEPVQIRDSAKAVLLGGFLRCISEGEIR